MPLNQGRTQVSSIRREHKCPTGSKQYLCIKKIKPKTIFQLEKIKDKLNRLTVEGNLVQSAIHHLKPKLVTVEFVFNTLYLQDQHCLGIELGCARNSGIQKVGSE